MPYGTSGAEYGASGGQRDRITQALMNIQNPPPAAEIQAPPPMSPLPQSATAGASPPAATGTPGVSPMAGAPGMLPQLNSAVPNMMQPGGMLAPQAGTPPQMPAMPRY